MEKMKKINIAANVLKNPNEKQEHDRDLYYDAVNQKKRSPRANFSTNSGMSLSPSNIKNLAKMANVNESVDDSRIKFHFKTLRTNIVKSISTQIVNAYEQANDVNAKELIKTLFEISNIQDNDLPKLKSYKKFLG
jgi:DnaJ-class molecular chaperone